MKFGELIEYNNGNIFLQKSCRKWGKETISTPQCKDKFFGNSQLG